MAMRLAADHGVAFTRLAVEAAGLTATGAAGWIAANGGDYVTSGLIITAAGSIFLGQRLFISRLMKRIAELEARVDELTRLLTDRGHS